MTGLNTLNRRTESPQYLESNKGYLSNHHHPHCPQSNCPGYVCLRGKPNHIKKVSGKALRNVVKGAIVNIQVQAKYYGFSLCFSLFLNVPMLL